MKKKNKCLFLLALFLSTAAQAQITQGNWLVGGSISYASTRYNSENFGPPHDDFRLSIQPNIGYFPVDKLGAGIKVNINKSGDKTGNNYTDFNIGPFVRYYLLNPEKMANILCEGAYQYGFLQGGYLSLYSPDKNTFAFSAGPVVYFNSAVGMEFLITYSTYKFVKLEGRDHSILFGVGLQVHLEKK